MKQGFFIFLLLCSKEFFQVEAEQKKLHGREALTWLTKTCNSSLVSGSEFRDSLRGRKIGFFGDSILRNMFGEVLSILEPSVNTLSQNAGNIRYLSKQTKNLSRKHSGKFKYWSFVKESLQLDIFYAHSTKILQKLIDSGLFKNNIYTDVIISNAAWDLGTHFHGHRAYFENLSNILSFFDEKSNFGENKPKIILLGLHYINRVCV